MKIRHIILLVLTLLAASFAVNAQTNPEGLYLKKSVKEVDPDKPNNYELNLESFVTGIKVPGGGPVDVLFILDLSTSMDDENKLGEMKTATKSFLNVLSPNKDAKVAIVTFSRDAELITSPAFTPVKNNISQLNSLVDGLETIAQTNIDKGAKLGLSTFQGLTDPADTPRFCIILTDGEPGTTLHPDYGVAETTWQATYEMKKMGVTVYTIFLGTSGINKALEPDSDGSIMNTRNFLDGTSSNFVNNYFNIETSNNNNIPNMWVDYYIKNGEKRKPSRSKANDDNLWAPRVESKYFIEVADPAELEGVFEDIASEISEAALPLSGEATEVIDIVSNSFKLPDIAFNTDGTLKSEFIKLYAVKCTGTRPLVGVDAGFEYVFDDEHPIALPTTDPDHPDFANVQVLPQDANKKKITVTGFDFEKNYVAVPQGETARGYKLVIKFNIVIDPSFPGGASAVTNEEGSGIYFDADGDGIKEQIGWFPVPSVKVPNIVVIKNGLHKGESAIFKVYKIENGNRSVLPLMLVATQGDNLSYAIAKVKIQRPGRYEVEETGWSWAYTIDGRQSAYGADDTNIQDEQWNEKGYGTGDEYAFPIPTVKGTEVPDNSTSIIRNVNDFTEEDSATYNYKGTFFIFTNKDKESTPAHAEANKNNEFKEVN